MGGRLTLIQSMLSSFPILQYVGYVLPEGVKRNLYGLFNRFLFGGSVNKCKLHLVNWENTASLMAARSLEVIDLGVYELYFGCQVDGIITMLITKMYYVGRWCAHAVVKTIIVCY